MMGDLLRDKDWSKTELGSVETWSQSLLTVVSVIMSSTFPMALWWGPQSIKLYNDGYIPMTGEKHPALYGARAKGHWGEIWDVLGPAIDSVMNGASTYHEDKCLMMRRYGFLEVLYITMSLTLGNLFYLGFYSCEGRNWECWWSSCS